MKREIPTLFFDLPCKSPVCQDNSLVLMGKKNNSESTQKYISINPARARDISLDKPPSTFLTQEDYREKIMTRRSYQSKEYSTIALPRYSPFLC